jgi:hypothetical protein
MVKLVDSQANTPVCIVAGYLAQVEIPQAVPAKYFIKYLTIHLQKACLKVANPYLWWVMSLDYAANGCSETNVSLWGNFVATVTAEYKYPQNFRQFFI